MKKIISCVLCMLLLVTLFGCSSNSQTPDKILEEATPLVISELRDAYNANVAKAVQDYEGKKLSYTGTVLSIDKTSCQIKDMENDETALTVKLKSEDLVTLNTGDMITVVGEIKDVRELLLINAVLIKTVAREDNIDYLVKTFIDDFDSAVTLIEKKESFTKLTGKEIKEILPSGWVLQERYYKNENGKLKSVATFRAIISINKDGSGHQSFPTNQSSKWLVENDKLYYKLDEQKDDIKDRTFCYSVYRIDDKTLICYGEKNTVFILINNMLAH